MHFISNCPLKVTLIVFPLFHCSGRIGQQKSFPFSILFFWTAGLLLILVNSFRTFGRSCLVMHGLLQLVFSRKVSREMQQTSINLDEMSPNPNDKTFGIIQFSPWSKIKIWTTGKKRKVWHPIQMQRECSPCDMASWRKEELFPGTSL